MERSFRVIRMTGSTVPARLASCRDADAARMLVLTLRPAREPSATMTFCTVTPAALRGKEGLTLAL